MSFSNSGGGTLTVPSPTHVHHVDVFSSGVRTLRRSLSRSPSKFNLGRTNSQTSSDSSLASQPQTASEQSPCRRLSPMTRSQNHSTTPVTAPSLFSSTTPLHAPPTTSLSHFSPSVKLSLRSAKSSKSGASPSRPLSRLRASPKSPLKRTLSSTNNSESSTPLPSGSNSPGQENSHNSHNSTTQRSPLTRGGSIPRRPLEKSSRHSLHLDVSGSAHQALVRALEGNGDLLAKVSIEPGTAGSGALKRSDAIMDLDQPNVSSPVAKRRSLHGISSLGYTDVGGSIFGGANLGATPVAMSHNNSFEIHEDITTSNREYELFGSGSTPAPREPIPSPTPTPSIPRRTGSLRKSTLQQRQHDRSSWGRRSGANHLAQMGGEFATPNVKNRPRLSMDQFLPPQVSRDSPFVSTTPSAPPPQQPHPLSKTLITSASGNSLEERTSTNVAPAVFAKPQAPVNFAKSLPYGIGQPDKVTPFKDVKPWAGAFMSTGLISKVNRNPEDDLHKVTMPDTPCKKPTNGFATYPPPPGSAMKKRNGGRSGFGLPSATPFNNTSPTHSRSIFSSSNPTKGLSLFQRLGPRHSRRGSLLSMDGDDKKFTFESSSSVPAVATTEAPPTPTKQSISTPVLSEFAERDPGSESPSAQRSMSFFGTGRPPQISRESTASPVELRTPKTPQASVVLPDASHLSISNPVDFRQSMGPGTAPPVTPSGRESFFNSSLNLSTPVNGNGRAAPDVDDSLYSRFDKVELVGKGEFSSVYRVVKSASLRASFLSVFSGTPSKASPRSPEPDRYFAVKKARKPFLGPKDRENKLREVRALQALTHADHVLRYVDSWEFDHHLFIQTEFCDEGTLDKFLSNVGRKGRLDDFRIWKIIHDVALGLQSIHDAGFMHLDLKPANILITFEGILKIGDFGLATPWPAAKGVDAEGDREYIGPEILRGKFDKPADIFALGLIMIEMACNVVLPDNGPTWVALRSGDFSEVPSLTFSTATTTGTFVSRDAVGVSTMPSQDDSLVHQLSTTDVRLAFDEAFNTRSVSDRSLDSPKRSELQSPPDFMRDIFHPNSLDQMARWMTKPEPSERPTVHQLLDAGGMAWVASRRRSAATVFEGVWGPGDVALRSDEDTEMTDV
ncbi:mitosis inhibitor protein kinase SWE1 [Plectosphaerella plurivora]|uniref:Mitosis inhibitor protein kinase SWE1 n=1 Tax=Plectosphaerella plurivora TaxID=936078 RepID=A0A9P8VQ62_9PEZI|nr:mitosis inhibitor protein kinase SWE1 [Plectosphaerella plurivora]